ncbi:TonB-dependent receptor domain-containing protein [Hyphobacterium marinum]|uniref:TonB-dependent receptor n=1 Tax=Hyphobacterium marinum TaxID=3116574 RepID=A0ABU7LWA3_9PROT|nr:TonB-dependent receptor [Hyphobacterium sp. Y6023]MEE2565756.1 TonB-dependent receptor [Hyphobacterium sp. Y6023]
MKPVTSLSGVLLATTMLFSTAPAFAQDAEVAAEETGDTIVVRGRFIPEPQRQTAQVASFVTPEDLLRSGDDNAAIALTRLSGLSIVDGRFAYVRGLGDRYSAALLNGSPLPSPEPLRRTVPLDLFPSDTLDRISVQKTYSANYSAEFGGGLIDLRTLRRPLEDFLNLSVSTGFNTETTGEDGLFHYGSDQDWTGYDDGLRDLPAPLQALVNSRTTLSSQTDAQIEAAGEALVNSPLSVIQTGELRPNGSFGIDGGMALNAGDFEIGIIGAAGYSQGWETQRATRQFVLGDVIGNDFRTTETSLNITTNALGSISADNGDHLFQLTGFYVHNTSKESQIDTGRDFNAQGATGEIYDESTGWYERELGMLQLAGEHTFGNLEFTWRGSAARATRDAPYERSLRRYVDATGQISYEVANSYNVRFSDLTDDLTNAGAELQYTFDFADGREVVLMAGADASRTEREYNFLAFRFAGGNSLPQDVRVARPDFLFGPDNIDPNRFVLQEITTPNDSYTASLDVDAFFVQADFDITSFIRATAGLRYEDATQTVQTFDRFGNLGAGAVGLNNDYVLPALTFTWNFADDLQLRLGYSETIARPQFRELALSAFFDPESERIYRGNNGLVDTTMRNFDARLEYYMGRDQFVTVAGFYKELENPIEEVQFSTSTFVFESTFINSPEAVVSGAEIEYRTYFQMPFEAAFFRDRDWRFSINYTYTATEVQASPTDMIYDPVTRSLRSAAFFNLDGSELQGSPENIVNAQFGWESDDDQLTLLLNWVDERILQRGLSQPGAALPDVIEDPGIQLDVNYRRDFTFEGQDFTVAISGRNLLQEAHSEFQRNPTIGITDFNTYDRGTTASISLTTHF